MIRFSYLIVLLTIVSCTRQSSPDGRSQLRDEHIQLQIDSLKQQYQALLDSISVINNKLNAQRL